MSKSAAELKTKQEMQKIQLDISKLDRTTIIWMIRSAYRRGYNQIHIHYDNLETMHLRKSDRFFVRDAVRDQVNRTLGARFEIIDQHNSVLYVDHQEGDPEEISRRVLKKLIELHAEFLLVIKGHLYAASLVEERHDSLTKLLTYCQLLLTKKPHAVENTIAYHLLACIDKIADILKYMARDYLTVERPMSKTGIAIFAGVQEYLLLYEKVHHKCRTSDILQLMLKRDDIKRQMRASLKSMDPKEAFLLGQETSILEILIDVFEARLSLELK
jgi:hypothetical protein